MNALHPEGCCDRLIVSLEEQRAGEARFRSIHSHALTSREIEVIERMYRGKTNEEIANLLSISVYTVKNHVRKILLKLSATNRTQAVMRAVDAGILRGAVEPFTARPVLTPREIQVLGWIYHGKTDKEIATLLGNSLYTVKNNVQKILAKLAAANRTQAVLRAVDAGLL